MKIIKAMIPLGFLPASTLADKITAKMKELGFVYITLDAEGFRSGSMDVHIVK